MESLTWQNIRYTCKDKDGKERVILSDISGTVQSKYLLCIMGSTGSGKTTLLNALSGSIKTGYTCNHWLSGSMIIKRKPDSSNRKLKIGYVKQIEYCYPYISMKETLLLAASFNSSNRSKDIETKVDNIIDQFNLTSCKDLILDYHEISQGELRRLNIIKALLYNPDLLFIDEVTADLDSFQAAILMKCLKDIAINDNRLIISTIQQPSSQLYSKFDYLLLLSEGGQTIYYGKTDYAVRYFASLNCIVPCNYNPSDYFIEITSINQSLDKETSQRSRDSIKLLADKWNEYSNLSIAFDREILEAVEEKIADDEELGYVSSNVNMNNYINYMSDSYKDEQRAIDDYHDIRRKKSITVRLAWHFKIFRLLSWRSSCIIFNNYAGLSIRCISALFFAVLLSLIYRGSGTTSTDHSLQDIIGLLFFMTINMTFGPAMSLVSVFEREIPILYNESKLYSIFTFFIARVLLELLIQVALSIIYSYAIYFSVGFPLSMYQSSMFTIIIVLLTIASCSFGFFLSSCSKSTRNASTILAPILITSLLFAGYFINISNLPAGSKWVRLLSFNYWSFGGLISVIFKDQDNKVLQSLSLDEFSELDCVVALIIYSGILLTLSYVCLTSSQPRYLSIRVKVI